MESFELLAQLRQQRPRALWPRARLAAAFGESARRCSQGPHCPATPTRQHTTYIDQSYKLLSNYKVQASGLRLRSSCYKGQWIKAAGSPCTQGCTDGRY